MCLTCWRRKGTNAFRQARISQLMHRYLVFVLHGSTMGLLGSSLEESEINKRQGAYDHGQLYACVSRDRSFTASTGTQRTANGLKTTRYPVPILRLVTPWEAPFWRQRSACREHGVRNVKLRCCMPWTIYEFPITACQQ